MNFGIVHIWIGINFLVIPGCILWLYYHRRTEWPRSWTLALLGVSVGSCGVSRILHGLFDDHWPSYVFDVITAVTGTVLAALAPKAVRVFSKIPSPREIEIAIQGNLTKKVALAEAVRANQMAELHRIYAERAESRFTALEALLNHYPLDPEVKERILKAVKEVND